MRTLVARAFACCIFLGCLGCGGVGAYRKTGGTYAPRGPNCEYRVIREQVLEPHAELGVVDIDAFSMKQLPDNEERFRKVVGPRVCAAGGDAVIPTLDIYGHWVHGTIIRFNPSQCVGCEPKSPQGEGG